MAFSQKYVKNKRCGIWEMYIIDNILYQVKISNSKRPPTLFPSYPQKWQCNLARQIPVGRVGWIWSFIFWADMHKTQIWDTWWYGEKNLIEAFVIFLNDVCPRYAIQNSITKVVELSESDWKWNSDNLLQEICPKSPSNVCCENNIITSRKKHRS